jgi:hypothetical protein
MATVNKMAMAIWIALLISVIQKVRACIRRETLIVYWVGVVHLKPDCHAHLP